MLAAILAFASLTMSIIWSIVFLPLSFTRFRINKVVGSRMKKFLKTVSHSSIRTNDEPDGWICGKWFIGYIHVVSGERNETRDLWLLCSKTYYEQNVQQNETDENGKTKKITYWTRENCFWRLLYNSRQINLPKFPVNQYQQTTIDKIMEVFNKKGNAVCLLFGRPGGGKSMTAQYLCAEFLKTKKGVSFCKSHKPYEHGDNFDSFYNQVNPTEDFPLVLVLEEIDGLIVDLHRREIIQGQHNPIQIKNKTDWDTFLDDFNENQMLYPNIVLIMTTNKTPEFFDELDSAYFRGARLDLSLNYIENKIVSKVERV